MEERIVKFIAALRAAGVRISLAESADAFQAVGHLGIKDRELFRLSLQTTLVKDANNLPIFEELFPIFFGGDEMPADDQPIRRPVPGRGRNAGRSAAPVQRPVAQDAGKAD